MRGMPSIGDLANDVARWAYAFRISLAVVSLAVLVLAVATAHRRGWFRAAGRHPWRTAIVAALVLAVTVPVGWYLGSPIFLRTSLVEAGPVGSAVTPGPVSTPSPAPSVVASAAPTAPPTPSPSPFVPMTLARGEFHGTDDFHFGRGTASVIEVEPGRHHLRLDEFSVRNGPDLYVYLSPDADGYVVGAIEVGKLKATDGSFGYDLPDGTDPGDFASVLIWCKQFSHLFAVAPFEA
jgi:hypothetical protein